MSTLTIRNLPDAVHAALRLRAAKNGRSVEAEVRALLAESLGLVGVAEGAAAGFEVEPRREGEAFSFVGSMRGQFSMPSPEKWKAMDKEIELMFLGEDDDDDIVYDDD